MWSFCNVLLGTGCDSCRQCVRLVAALLIHCRYFLQMSHFSETTSGTVREYTRHVSMLDDALIILERLLDLVMAIIT